MTKRKKVVLKLGGMCNLHCKNCHNTAVQYTYNPDIVAWMNGYGVDVLHLSGGEPFLYVDLMKEILPKLKTVQTITVTTNGTLVTDDIAAFCNDYNMNVSVSYDGTDSTRDPMLPNYEAISKIHKNGISSVFYHGNTNIEKIQHDVQRLGRIHDLSCKNNITHVPAFVHQTAQAPNLDTTREDAKRYIQQVGVQLELGFMNYSHHKENRYSLGAVFWFIRHYLDHMPYTIGSRCCNPRNVALAIDGRFLLCPYGTDAVGDIYSGIDWDKVESHIPDACKLCPIRDVCGTACAAQITDNECYIMRCLYRHYKKLITKYGIDEQALLSLDYE